MNKKKNKKKVLAFIFSVVFIGLGYAYLSANLKISGIAHIGNSRFNVHFANPTVVSASDTVTFPSNSNSNITPGTPVISGNNDLELSYEITLNQPGDHYGFTVDVVNGGDMDALEDLTERTLKLKIDNGSEMNINLSNIANDSNWPSFLQYSFDYVADTSFNPETPNLIKSNKSVKMRVELKLSENITNEEWNRIRGKTLKITSGFSYIQN